MKPDQKPYSETVFGSLSLGETVDSTFCHISYMASLISLAPNAIPSARRVMREAHEGRDRTFHPGGINVYWFNMGILYGTALIGIQTLLYKVAIQHDNPEFLAIPIITNVASGVYESVRKKKGMKRKLPDEPRMHDHALEHLLRTHEKFKNKLESSLGHR